MSDTPNAKVHGEAHGRAVLTEANVIAIRTGEYKSDRTWAAELKVKLAAIVRARLGYTWAHLNETVPPRRNVR